HLARLPLVSGNPNSSKMPSTLSDLGQVVLRGQKEIEALVRLEMTALAGECAEQLARERNRLEQHYQCQLEKVSKRDEESRQRLKEMLNKEIEDFERKYS